MGEGLVQVYADFESNGAPRSLGVRMTASALSMLPEMPNTYSRCFDKNKNGRIDPHGECNGDYEFAFPIPLELAQQGNTAFTWIGVNWNPMGHPLPAPPPWAEPHFDFHFYIQPEQSVRAIRSGPCSELIDCDDFKVAQKSVPERYLHPDHIDVGAAVPAMGNHLIDSRSPELAPDGPRFTHTFIYGAYDGHISFYEPMITHAYLRGKPSSCTPLKQPQAFEQAGYYPSEYCIRYSGGDDGVHTISLEKFEWRDAG